MTQTHTYEEAYQESLQYFGGRNELSPKVFVDKYALRDQDGNMVELTPDDMHRRLAKEFARVEKKKFKKPLSEEEIYDLFRRFSKIIPQGSPMYGIGNPYQYVSLSNCYVLDPPLDSYGSILDTDEELVQISKRRGGVGISLDNLRPSGMATRNSSRTSTGVVSFAQRYSNSIREVGQQGRRGALMLTLNVHHPQVLDFAHCKDDEVSVTGANISIALTDEFLTAVMNGEEYEQRWPVNSDTPVISRMVDAREVWMEIIKAAHGRAEPGLIFWDRAISESPADCYADVGFKTVCTNPCSEIFLSILDSCRLLLVNLFSCVRNPFSSSAYLDFDMLYELAGLAQRLMDDLVDLEIEAVQRIIAKIEADPEPEHIKTKELRTWQRILEACINGRRTGTGITALGDTLAALGIKYGSQASIEMTEEIYKTLKLGAYRSSVDMAKELGAFPVWDAKKETKCPFLLRIAEDDPKLYKDMQKHGRRNIALLTTAPTGSTSILASLNLFVPNTGFKMEEKLREKFSCVIEPVDAGYNLHWHGTTAGIEPLFKDVFTRRKKGNPGDEKFRSDFVDATGDHWMEFDVHHPGLEAWMVVNESDDIEASPYRGACADNIDWVKRVELQAAAQRHIDHSISSTINLPNNVSVERVAEVYETAWKAGCKGITVYRDGCRSGVLIDSNKSKKAEIVRHNAPERPKELECDVYHVSVKGVPYFVLVGLLDGQPYEVFAGKNGFISKKIKKGKVVKVLRPKCYKAIMDDGTEIQPITMACDEEQEALTRMISTGLRHGTPINFMVDQLEKVGGDMTGFARSIARSLKKYIPDGTKVDSTCDQCSASDSLVRQEGCVVCMSCGASKCM